MIRCAHGKPVAVDGSGCAACGGPALDPRPDPYPPSPPWDERGLEPQQPDEPDDNDPRAVPWWQR